MPEEAPKSTSIRSNGMGAERFMARIVACQGPIVRSAPFAIMNRGVIPCIRKQLSISGSPQGELEPSLVEHFTLQSLSCTMGRRAVL